MWAKFWLGFARIWASGGIAVRDAMPDGATKPHFPDAPTDRRPRPGFRPAGFCLLVAKGGISLHSPSPLALQFASGLPGLDFRKKRLARE